MEHLEPPASTGQPAVAAKTRPRWPGILASGVGTFALAGTSIGFLAAQPIIAVALAAGAIGVGATGVSRFRSTRDWEPAVVTVSSTEVKLGEQITGAYTRSPKRGAQLQGVLEGQLHCREHWYSNDGKDASWRSAHRARIPVLTTSRIDDRSVRFDFAVAVPVDIGTSTFELACHKVTWELDLRLVTSGFDDVHRIELTVLPEVHEDLV